MKIINLNKFKKTQTVEIDGIQYQVNTATVKMFVDDTLFSFGESATMEDQRRDMKKIVDMLVEISTIPREVLVAQPIEMLTALIQVSQGIDPTEEVAEEEGAAEGNAE